MVEPQIVVLDVAGSSPVGHPIFSLYLVFFSDPYSLPLSPLSTLNPQPTRAPSVVRSKCQMPNVHCSMLNESPHPPHALPSPLALSSPSLSIRSVAHSRAD